MKPKKTASVLAFERKLCPSDGAMFYGNWNDRDNESLWRPIDIQNKDVRGTISNRLKKTVASDPLRVNAEIEKPNLQRVDIASLPLTADTLKLTFTLRVLGNIFSPCACNDQNYQQVLTEKINSYIASENFRELSLRYSVNIANGRYLWRNRIGAEKIEVVVSLLVDEQVKNKWKFDALKYSLKKFSDRDDVQLQEMAACIQSALRGNSYCFLKIDAYACLGLGQEVFPSQEMVLEKGGDKHKKSKILYAINGMAAMHSQKLGNAIRTIDTWYPDYQTNDVGPIPVEPYGSVTNRGVAYRQKCDFYTLLDNWIIKDKIPSLDEQHYVIACLIRGGVYGEKDDK